MLPAVIRRNPSKSVIITLTMISLLYLSKPDRGGIGRCERIFGFDSLGQRGLEMRRLWAWNLFEDPKFRMKIDKAKAAGFKAYLATRGYTEWAEKSIQYGSFNLGGDGSTATFISAQKIDGNSYIMVHDETHDLIYAVVFYD